MPVFLYMQSINSNGIIPRNISLMFATIDVKAPRTESVNYSCSTLLDVSLSNDEFMFLNVLNCPLLDIDKLYMGTLAVASSGCKISMPFEISELAVTVYTYTCFHNHYNMQAHI